MNITTDGYTKLYLSSSETNEFLSDLRHLPSRLSVSTTFYLEHLKDASRKNGGSEIMMSGKHCISELLADLYRLQKLKIKLRPITKLIIHHLEYISPYY
jgi:hypothetical protein